MIKYLPFLLLLIVFTSSCSKKTKDKQSYAYYYTEQQKDSIMADIITHIYIPSKRVKRMRDKMDRFDQKNRSFYVGQIQNFKLDKLFVADDSTHYFFLIRPAISSKGNLRGVGGKFKINKDKKVSDFEEIFNTPVIEENEIKERGHILFHELVNAGNIDRFHFDPNYMEWPDGRSVYSKERYEWVYVRD